MVWSDVGQVLIRGLILNNGCPNRGWLRSIAGSLGTIVDVEAQELVEASLSNVLDLVTEDADEESDCESIEGFRALRRHRSGNGGDVASSRPSIRCCSAS